MAAYITKSTYLMGYSSDRLISGTDYRGLDASEGSGCGDEVCRCRPPSSLRDYGYSILLPPGSCFSLCRGRSHDVCPNFCFSGPNVLRFWSCARRGQRQSRRSLCLHPTLWSYRFYTAPVVVNEKNRRTHGHWQPSDVSRWWFPSSYQIVWIPV
jgi:hypothetical protein